MEATTNAANSPTTALVPWMEWNLRQITLLGYLYFWLLDRATQNTEN